VQSLSFPEAVNGRLPAADQKENLVSDSTSDRVRVAVVDYPPKAEVYAEYGADFDPEAVENAVLAELNRRMPDGVVIERNGAVYASGDAVQAAERIDWEALLAEIDVAQILADHAR
jgi:hypothetical protein